MLKKSFIVIFILTFFHVQSQEIMDNSIYQFKVEDIYGKTYDFSKLKGKKIMIVNTASKCGLTYQYKALQELYNNYSIYDFIVIGFPSNDFLWQEPGSNEEIIEFCEENYGVTFPMMTKVKVKGLNKQSSLSILNSKSKK
tara:strand:+ start:192 stop:611 length:420 start_codon:yes stop_codon:yes gene_type:complete